MVSGTFLRTPDELTWFERGRSTRSTLFYYYVDDLCHKMNIKKALEEGKRTTTVASDVPSVLNSASTAEGPQVSVGWDELSNAVHTDGRGVAASSVPTVDAGTWAVGICCGCWGANVSPVLAQLRFSCPTEGWKLSCQSP